MKVAFQGNTTRPQEVRDYRRRFGTTRGMSVPSESLRSVPVIRPRVKTSTASITTNPKRNLTVESYYRSLLSKAHFRIPWYYTSSPKCQYFKVIIADILLSTDIKNLNKIPYSTILGIPKAIAFNAASIFCLRSLFFKIPPTGCEPRHYCRADPRKNAHAQAYRDLTKPS
ncbi:predicted protein [Histoplasma capsulatum H143]|uniref:Uncharacterized protein n=1 Tax=Ajellomyces capsulatus (strain H143) TaxID=544712 RepID=C6HPF2_AJECH|nr:predicted protein [Histoplasma capsulatum H143]